MAAIDLNLLTAFITIWEEASVTEAARRLGLTQPAVSHKLRRLREELGDPLFVSSPQGLVPTSRASAMAGPVRRLLAELETAVLGEEAFDPATATRRFVVASADLFEFAALPGVLEQLACDAPGVGVVVRPTGSGADIVDGMIRGEIDVWMTPRVPDVASLRRMMLFDEGFVVMGREGHPLLRGRLTLAKYLRARHLLIAPHGRSGGYVDEALAGMGRRREVGVQVAHFAAAPFLAAGSDLLLTGPETLADVAGRYVSLVHKPPPVELPRVRNFMVWHERFERDPGHRWFRGAARRFVDERARRA